MESRPRIKLTLSPLDKKLELLGKLFLVLLWSLTVFTFVKLPTTIPTHFNASGQADGYGDKLSLIILPFIATIIYFGLTALNKYPHVFNYMTEITEDNAQVQYTIATRMLRFLKLAVLIIFSFIIIFTYLTTIGVTKGLGIWFLPVTSGLILIPTIISIIQSSRKTDDPA